MARMHSEPAEGWRILKVNALAGSATYELVVRNFRVGCLGCCSSRFRRRAYREQRAGCRGDLRSALREFDINDRGGSDHFPCPPHNCCRCNHCNTAIQTGVSERTCPRETRQMHICTVATGHINVPLRAGRCATTFQGHELWETFAR